MAILKSMEALVAHLNTLKETTTVADLKASTAFLALVTAKRGGGGGTGEDQFVTINDVKVARICALTHGIYPHDNSNKDLSFFYKNGSYSIGAEVLKANARKQWEFNREDELQVIEDEMMNGDINPKEWKEKATAINSNEFNYIMSEDDIAELKETFNAYDTKEDFITAYEADDITPFSDYADEITALRALAPKRPVVATEEEA